MNLHQSCWAFPPTCLVLWHDPEIFTQLGNACFSTCSFLIHYLLFTNIYGWLCWVFISAWALCVVSDVHQLLVAMASLPLDMGSKVHPALVVLTHRLMLCSRLNLPKSPARQVDSLPLSHPGNEPPFSTCSWVLVFFSALTMPCLLLSRMTNSTWEISPNTMTLTVTPMLKTVKFIVLKIFLSSVLKLVSLYFLQLVILCLPSSYKPHKCTQLSMFQTATFLFLLPRSVSPIMFFNSAADSVPPSISIS